MSLQIAAKHLAAKGRGPDTTLVHMTNKEVQGLQALAEKNGGSLSINPDTGLPEAGFLESILPLVAGVGLAAAGMPAGYAALTVGGVTALSTGNLSKGLYAGLGAYGGASLGQQLAVQGMGEAAAANASFGDKLAGMGDASAFSSFENAGKFISANKLPAMAAAAGPLLSSMEDEKENDKPSEPVKDTDPGARARSGIKFNPGYMTPTPLPNPYGIEQTYATPYYAAEGGVTHMAEGGMAYGGSTSIDTKSQFADYLNKVMNPTNRTNAVSGSTNPYEWWKSPSTPEAAPAAPAETYEEYAARMSLNARGGGGGMSPEQRAEQAADNAKPQPMFNGLSRDQFFKLSPEEQNAVRAQADADNPKTAAFFNAVKFAASPVKFLYDKLAPPPAPSEMQKYIDAADAESRILTRDRAYEAYGNSIEGVTAADAANAAYQRDQAEAANLARMQADTYPSGNFVDAPLSSRTDISGHPLRESELKSFEKGLAPTSAIDASKPTIPDFTAISQADEAALKAEQAQQRAVEEKQKVAAELGYMKNAMRQDLGVLEGDKGFVFMDKYSSLQDQLNKFDSPYRDSFAPTSAKGMYTADAAANAINNLEPGDRFAPVDYSEQYLSPEAYQAEVDKLNEALTPYSAADEADRMFAAPDIVGINEISADPNADKTAESLGIPSAETFAAMIGAPIGTYASAADGSTVSDAGVLGGVPAPNVGYGQGRGAFGIGGVWTNREGVPITTRDGSPVMTGEGAAAMQRAVAESNAAANRTYGNSINSGPANDGRADPGGEGGTRYGSVAAGYTGGSEAADGGLSTPYGFQHMANGGLSAMATPYDLGSYSDGGRLLKGPGDGVSDSIPATIGKGRPARLADGEFVIPARIVSEIGNGSTEAGARKLYAMMDRIQASRRNTVGKGKVAVNNRADKYLPA